MRTRDEVYRFAAERVRNSLPGAVVWYRDDETMAVAYGGRHFDVRLASLLFAYADVDAGVLLARTR